MKLINFVTNNSEWIRLISTYHISKHDYLENPEQQERFAKRQLRTEIANFLVNEYSETVEERHAFKKYIDLCVIKSSEFQKFHKF